MTQSARRTIVCLERCAIVAALLGVLGGCSNMSSLTSGIGGGWFGGQSKPKAAEVNTVTADQLLAAAKNDGGTTGSIGGGQKLVLGDGIDLGGLGLALPAEPAAADPGRERGHVAAAAKQAQQRGRDGAPFQAGESPTSRLRHDALVRTLARPLADRYSLPRRA